MSEGRHRREEKPLSERSFAELPPKPDPETGQPFPPEAGYYIGPDLPHEQVRGPMNGRPPRLASPPEGMGRTLAWRQIGARDALARVLSALVINVIIVAVISWLSDFQLRALEFWQMWAILAVFTYLMSDPLARQVISAGADWVQWKRRPKWYERRRDRGTFLKIYRLTKIEGYGAGAVLYVRIVDEDGRGIDRTRTELHPDRRIWDLMYNGIQHSIANGCEINSLAVEMLHLENSPALRLREAHDEE